MDIFPTAFPLDLSSVGTLMRRLVLDLSLSELSYLTSITEASLILTEKGKSFYFASMIFPSRCRHSLVSIYAVCRVMDDSVDNAANLLFTEQYLADVRSYIKTAASTNLPLCFFQLYSFLQLIQGFETDLRFSKAADISQFPIQTENDLIQYCKCVASTVAQMFVHAVWNAEAEMGIALQLVNVARDIVQDACNGRSYIPLEWVSSPDERSELVELTKDPRNLVAVSATRKYSVRLVQMARSYYLQAEKGLVFLPQEYVKGARLMLDVYMAIGEKILERDGDISQRVSLDTKQKIKVAAKVLYK